MIEAQSLNKVFGDPKSEKAVRAVNDVTFSVKPGEEEISRKEWNDLKSMAGKDEYVAFGARYKPRGTVRAADAKPETPDVYATGFGLTKVKKHDYGPIKDLAELRKKGGEKPAKTASLK